MAGRKLKLNKDIIKKAGALINLGAYDYSVYTSLHLSKSAYYEWLKQGEEDRDNGKSSIFVEFLDTIESARANSEHRILNVVVVQALGDEEKGIKPNLEAAKFVLARRWPERWARHEIEIDHTVNVNITPLRPPVEQDLTPKEDYEPTV